ncbi:hypothetical protein [Deinococcus wulumuqiensis]|uniref:hypothetical protein n=1 Tax=Deinococcus wulumuqiensis TaxID=980427 RepID=UPI00242FC545|nr:hypothetical protein [Deinococcus wulumuqiensis]
MTPYTTREAASLIGLAKSQANVQLGCLLSRMGVERYRISGKRGLYVPDMVVDLLSGWRAEAQQAGVPADELGAWMVARINSLGVPAGAAPDGLAKLKAEVKAELKAELLAELSGYRPRIKRGRR